MYLGIDYLITRELNPYVVEVNVGLPGGAQEYDLAHRLRYGKPSNIFHRVEDTSLRVYGKRFKEYLHSLPFIESLKPFKIWMDGKGPFPATFHPGLRLEDKWVQYQLIHAVAPMPETHIFDPHRTGEAELFLRKRGKAVLKRRAGRGGRNFQVMTEPESLSHLKIKDCSYLYQEYIESKIEGYVFSIRSIAFGGEHLCMYANLARRPFSNHGILTLVSQGEYFGLADKEWGTEFFNEKSWEAEIWFGEKTPSYLRHNLYEEEVARTTLFLPEELHRTIEGFSVRIERFYEAIDLTTLPKAYFEADQT